LDIGVEGNLWEDRYSRSQNRVVVSLETLHLDRASRHRPK